MQSFLHKPAPLLVKNLNKLKPLINTLPDLSQLNIASTRNTTVACRVCRNKRIIGIRSRQRETLTMSHCIHCNGTGEMRIC